LGLIRFWKKATGLDYVWNPLFSDAFNEATRRMGTVAAQAGSWKDKDPKEMLKAAEQMDKDFATMRNEQRNT
jgi:hypothetical protein